jgi:hypothetical protein
MNSEKKQISTEKNNGTRCMEIVGDQVGTPDGKLICGGIILQSFTKLNEILSSNDVILTNALGEKNGRQGLTI